MAAKFSLDADELYQIGISIFAICLSLTFATAGLDIDPAEFIFYMAMFGITVGSGFVLHELAHKYVATRYGAQARFQAWTFGLFAMLAMAIVPQLLGFRLPLFLAPGAVMIYALRISQKQNGVIALAGPATNIALGMLFFAAGLLFFNAVMLSDIQIPEAELGIIATVVLMGARVNFYLAMFNLLPFWVLDGAKIIAWDWRVWLAMFALAWMGTSLISF